MAIGRSDSWQHGVPALVPAAPGYEEADFEYEAESADAEPVSGSWRPQGLLEWFAIAQTALPALLYLPGNQASRSFIRASAFLISIGVFAFWFLDRKDDFPLKHPSTRWLSLATVLLVLMMLHPDTDSMLAGIAQIALYFAVFCPVFWVPAFVHNRQKLIRVLAILLICNGVNSAVGVLQVYDPGGWMPSELSGALSQTQIDIASYTGPGGKRILRPPGLFDVPGAVCGAGTVAALLGLVFALEAGVWWKKIGSLGFSLLGLAAIYLSHVRSSLVISVAMMAAYVGMLALQKQKARVTAFLGLAVGVVVMAFSLATLLGGDTIRERVMTLFVSDPRDFYYESRGQQLQGALGDVVAKYPMGAGLARWGVAAGYVGVPVAQRLWAEVQPAAWMLDGGLFLVLLYSLALLAALLWELKLVRRLPDRNDRLWASVVVAVNIGTFALVFSFTPFMTQIGLQFWFLEGLLHGAMAYKLSEWT